jgi:hypothetical protein
MPAAQHSIQRIMQATTENGSTSIAEVRKTWKAFSFIEPEFNVPAHESQKQTDLYSPGAATVVRIKGGQVSFAGCVLPVHVPGRVPALESSGDHDILLTSTQTQQLFRDY